ncbi:MAG: hypothetical protein QM730_27355 [Anaerolineales bacterium]
MHQQAEPTISFQSNGSNEETVNTDINGYATSSKFTANTEYGFFNVTAKTSGLGDIVFKLQNQNLPGIPNQIIFTNGSNQSGVVNHPFYTPLTVRILDSFSYPVSNISVTFTITATGYNTATFASNNDVTETVTTNASGYATTSYINNTHDNNIGNFDITVSSPGLNQIKTTFHVYAPTVQTYTANNTTNAPGDYKCYVYDDPCNNGADNDAIKAHHYAIQTLNFYFSKHGGFRLTASGDLRYFHCPLRYKSP